MGLNMSGNTSMISSFYVKLSNKHRWSLEDLPMLKNQEND